MNEILEEKQRNQIIGGILYDDIIFAISGIYSSGTLQIIEKEDLAMYIEFANINHCMDWKVYIKEIMDRYNVNNEIIDMYESREWVQNNITDKILNKFNANSNQEEVINYIYNIIRNI